MAAAICSPRSSWRKWAPPSITTWGPAPGTLFTKTSPDFGLGKTGSESENATSVGFSQRAQLVADRRHLRRARPVGLEWHEQRERRGAGLRLGVRERGLVRRDHLVRQIRGGGPLDDEADRKVRVLLRKPAPGQEALAHAAGEQPGVHDHETIDPVLVLHRPAQPDRAAPVLDDDRGAGEVEAVEDAGDLLDVAVVAVPVEIGRLVGAPEAGEVRTDHPVAARHERRQHLAVQVRPRRLAVEADDGATRTLVEVVHPEAVHLGVVGLEVVARQVLEALVWGAEEVGHARNLSGRDYP